MGRGFIQKYLYHFKTQNILFNPLNTSKVTVSENVCLMVNVSIEAKSIDLDQTAHVCAVQTTLKKT